MRAGDCGSAAAVDVDSRRCHARVDPGSSAGPACSLT